MIPAFIHFPSNDISFLFMAEQNFLCMHSFLYPVYLTHHSFNLQFTKKKSHGLPLSMDLAFKSYSK